MQNLQEKNIKKVFNYIDKYDFISFDIFDTLLKRNVQKPTDIFTFIEQRYNENNKEKIKNFKNLRENAEIEARNHSKNDSNEIKLEDIYIEISRLNSKLDVEKLKKIEIEVELDFCQKSEDFFPIYHYALKKNKKIILVSDMYLSKDTIEKMLFKIGIKEYYKLYLSNDIGLNKRKGDIYNYILKDLKINKNQMIHFGDSKRADYFIPRLKGIKSIKIPTNINKIKYYNGFKNNYDEFIKYNSLEKFINNNLNNSNDVFFNIGYEVLGCLLYGYTMWLIDSLNSNNIKKIFFFAREGNLLKKAFDFLNKSDIQSRYLYVSRKSLILGLLKDVKDEKRINEILGLRRDITVDEYLKKSELRDIEKKEELIVKYLRQEKFEGKLAVADVGWEGTMQSAIQNICNRNNINADITGYYIGKSSRLTNKIQNKESIRNFLFENDSKYEYNMIHGFLNLFESFFLAFHGTTLGYEEKDNEIRPILDEYEYSKNDEEKFLSIQNGALKFIEDFEKSDIKNYYDIDYYISFRNFLRLGAKPTKSDLELFKNIDYVETKKSKFINAKSLIYYIFHPKKMYNDFSDTRWKIGFLKQVFMLNIDYYQIYKKLLDVDRRRKKMGDPIRVLQVFGEPLSNGGQESFLMNMYKNIDREKVQFDFFSPYYCDNEALKNEMESMGCNVYIYNGRFQFEGNKKDLIHNVKAFFDEHHYDIVHIHSGSTFALMYISKIAKKNGAKSVIIHSHCGGFKNLRYEIIKTISKPAFLKYPTHYFACSKLAAEWKFPKSIIKQNKYTIIKNAIDVSKIYYSEDIRKKTREELQIENKFVVGHIGRFSPQKNHTFLIDIFYEIYKKRKDSELLLIGTGELQNDIKEKVKKLGINNNVKFMNIRTDINELLNAMDVFILPSFFEGLPVVGVEAQGTGLPVYTSENVTRELPIEKLSYYYSLKDSADKWAEKILQNQKHFSRSNTTEELKSKGYEITAAAKKLEDFYLNLKTTIYIITHKKFKEPKLQGYLPLQVGKNIKEKLGYQKDNEGENISDRNQNYCELTGIYWIWKNDRQSKNIGLVHYRRYFTKCNIQNKPINVNEIERILKKYDIILPKKEIYAETAIEQYSLESGFKSDWDKIKEIIKEDCPTYLETFDKVMNGNKMYQYNMMICKKEIFDSYCNWLFNILFILEKNIDLDQRNDYQKRIYGFISERLLNIWVEKNDIKVKELKVYNTEESIAGKWRIRLRRIKNRIKFSLRKK